LLRVACLAQGICAFAASIDLLGCSSAFFHAFYSENLPVPGNLQPGWAAVDAAFRANRLYGSGGDGSNKPCYLLGWAQFDARIRVCVRPGNPQFANRPICNPSFPGIQ
jgi:hypothetical protein